MAKLSETAFHAWSQRNALAPETIAYLQRIRSSLPIRKVRSGDSNISGQYTSVKMGCSIQFESHHVELWALYTMERDEDVLEFYDQPTRLRLRYQTRSGRMTTQWHTPDFLVIRQVGAGFEEWKPATALDPLSVTQPHRYQRKPTGGWQSPPGETAAQDLGLYYRVRTSAEYHPTYIGNLKFLQDYWVRPFPVTAEQEAQVLTSLDAFPGVSVAGLLDAHHDLPVDVVWALLLQERIFTDLSAASLMQWDRVCLYRRAEEVPRPGARHDLPQVIPLASRLLWDGRLWEAEVQGDIVVLQPEIGAEFRLPAVYFQRLVELGVITPGGLATPSPMRVATRELLSHAGPKALEAANRRWREILAHTRGDPITVTVRSIQHWIAAFRRAEAECDCGYLGLLDQVARRGNRTARLPEESKRLLADMMTTHYAQPQAKRAAAVYRLYRASCEQQGILPVSERTFYRERARLATQEVTTLRRGKRAATASAPFFWQLDQTTPRHGERPFARAHLDHTELDLLLVSSVTGKPLARPWATFLTDAYSRRVVACAVSFDPPSYRSAMMAFRLCVQRYGRLPQELVVDGGPEFGSVYFESLLTQCFVTKLARPSNQPRFGSVVERLFGTTTTELLNQLRGNTQASMTPRHLTRAVDPQRLAVWTLERFASRLADFVYEVYDQMDHPALGQSPREAFAQGMHLAGSRSHRLIPYTEDFVMQTRPTTRTGTAKIQPGRGMRVHGLQYWHEAMRSPRVAGQTVPVRYEPYDMGVVYAYIGGQWLECLADDFAQVHGRSEREWHLILEEWRAQQRQHQQKRVTLNGSLLAQFLRRLEQDEALLLQRQRDLEEQAQRAALLTRLSQSLPNSQSLPTREAPARIEVDLTAIALYEEYH
jgi:putative transposase